jgi:hypothetical protein
MSSATKKPADLAGFAMLRGVDLNEFGGFVTPLLLQVIGNMCMM